MYLLINDLYYTAHCCTYMNPKNRHMWSLSSINRTAHQPLVSKPMLCILHHPFWPPLFESCAVHQCHTIWIGIKVGSECNPACKWVKDRMLSFFFLAAQVQHRFLISNIECKACIEPVLVQADWTCLNEGHPQLIHSSAARLLMKQKEEFITLVLDKLLCHL